MYVACNTSLCTSVYGWSDNKPWTLNSSTWRSLISTVGCDRFSIILFLHCCSAVISRGSVLLLLVMDKLWLGKPDHLKSSQITLSIFIHLTSQFTNFGIDICLWWRVWQFLTFCRPSRTVCRFLFRISSLDSYFILRSGTTAIKLKRMSW